MDKWYHIFLQLATNFHELVVIRSLQNTAIIFLCILNQSSKMPPSANYSDDIGQKCKTDVNNNKLERHL